MKLLLDTQLVLWAALGSEKLPASMLDLINEAETIPMFSAASIWEVAIKSSLGRPDFQVDPGRLRRNLNDNGWQELAITGHHAAATAILPALHKDPFDRLLVAQATVEGLVLWTADEVVAKYPGSVRLVKHASR
ncbi:MAG: type II toxin-antitoxin system VapC family toxin [Sphingomonadales bacterium]